MLWNVVSLLLPLAGYAFAKYSAQNANHGGNMGAAIGAGIVYLAIILAATLFGALAAIVALFRGERYVLLSILGLIANVALALKTLAPLFTK
jgi:hypothetical protein